MSNEYAFWSGHLGEADARFNDPQHMQMSKSKQNPKPTNDTECNNSLSQYLMYLVSEIIRNWRVCNKRFLKNYKIIFIHLKQAFATHFIFTVNSIKHNTDLTAL